MKRKSQAQRDAQLRAMEAARGAAARRADARSREAREQADREKAAAEHMELGLHRWTNWEYTEDYTHETRCCRECKLTETRKLRSL